MTAGLETRRSGGPGGSAGRPALRVHAPGRDAGARGVRSVVLRPGVVYGRGGGTPRMFVSAARRKRAKPALRNTSASRASPACAPSTVQPPSEIAWAQQSVAEAA